MITKRSQLSTSALLKGGGIPAGMFEGSRTFLGEGYDDHGMHMPESENGEVQKSTEASASSELKLPGLTSSYSRWRKGTCERQGQLGNQCYRRCQFGEGHSGPHTCTERPEDYEIELEPEQEKDLESNEPEQEPHQRAKRVRVSDEDTEERFIKSCFHQECWSTIEEQSVMLNLDDLSG